MDAGEHRVSYHSKVPSTPEIPLRHKKSLSAEAEEFYPSRRLSSPSTPPSSESFSRSGRPSKESIRPVLALNTTSPTVNKILAQLHGHPTPGRYNSQILRHKTSVEMPARPSDVVYSFDPSDILIRGSSLGFSAHSQMHHLPSYSHSRHITLGMENAYLFEQNDQNSEYSQSNPFESYANSTPAASTPNPSDVQTNAGIYAADTNGFSAAYFPSTNSSNQIV